MHIAVGQHVQQALFLVGIEAAGGLEQGWVFISTEEPVQEDDVTVIVLMAPVLMMNAVHFGSLEIVANPARRTYAGVLEKFI